MKEDRVRMTILGRSTEVAEESYVLLFSNRDRDAFLSALENSPEPNKNLKKAFLEYKKSLAQKD